VRSAFYAAPCPSESSGIFHDTIPSSHHARSKPWYRAFNGTNLLLAFRRVNKCITLFNSQMKEKKTVDMNLWGLYLAFDVMGEADYERGFGIIKTGIPHPACEMQRNTMGFLEVALILPWWGRMVMSLPQDASTFGRAMRWYRKQMERKIKEFKAGEKPRDLA
jgi:hypothetical protein